MRRILVTSAHGANGDGYGAVLCFSADGRLAGPFSEDRRITDPRGLSLSPAGDLVYVTSGDDRVLALDQNGTVVLDSGRTEGLDPGGGTFAPDGRYCVTLRRRGTILALPSGLNAEGVPLLPDGVVPFPRGFGFGAGGELYLSSGIGPATSSVAPTGFHSLRMLARQARLDPVPGIPVPEMPMLAR
jgi:DNA-binding beta-propeller fold protein YncE